MFHVELAPLGGILDPLKSDLGVLWPFRGPDFIMGKNKNANFSKRARCPILNFLVVIREVILQKMAPILAPVNFFSVLTLLGNCALKCDMQKKLEFCPNQGKRVQLVGTKSQPFPHLKVPLLELI